MLFYPNGESVNCVVEGNAPYIPHGCVPVAYCPPARYKPLVHYVPGCLRRPLVPRSGGGNAPVREKVIVKVASPGPETIREDEGDRVELIDPVASDATKKAQPMVPSVTSRLKLPGSGIY